MKTFVISDIHGCYNEFSQLLDMLAGDYTKDRLIILGDYIDRGPQSYEVLKKVIALQQAYGSQQIILLKGNHEQMAIDYYKKCSNWLNNGAHETLKSFAKNNEDLRNYIDFFRSLPTKFQDENFIYVHAGLRPGKDLSEQSETDLLWIREEFYLSSKVFEKTVVFGHTPTFYTEGHYNPIIKSDRISIDTACVYGGCLSAIEIIDGKVSDIYQVKSEIASRKNCA